MTQDQPLVVAAVLNHNGWRDAVECVRSLLANPYPNRRILVVDNGSTDDSVSELSRLVDGEQVLLAQTHRNLGSGGGTNFGIRRALEMGAEFILTLSNDLVAAPNLISVLVDTMFANPTIGAMAPKVMYYDEPEIIWSAGGRMNYWLGRASLAGSNARSDPRDTRVLDVDILIGCAMFLRRSMLEQVGLLDERYFYQNEEYEFFDRLRRRGWRVGVAMGTSALHKIGRTVGAESYARWYYATRNRLLFIGENLSPPQRLVAMLAFWATRPAKFMEWLLKGKPSLIRATVDGAADYYRRRLGQGRLEGQAR